MQSNLPTSHSEIILLPETPAIVDQPDFLFMRDVSVARGDNVVLHNISLRIAIGEHVAILGPNGCGKSTLIKNHHLPVLSHRHTRHATAPAGPRALGISQLRTQLGVVSGDSPASERPSPQASMPSSPDSSPHPRSGPISTSRRRSERAREALHLMQAEHLGEAGRECPPASSAAS